MSVLVVLVLSTLIGMALSCLADRLPPLPLRPTRWLKVHPNVVRWLVRLHVIRVDSRPHSRHGSRGTSAVEKKVNR
jgi:hypothetical protein